MVNFEPVNILIVDSELLGFNLLLGMDIIKMLGWVHMTELNKFCFSNAPICAAIKIDESDFSMQVNQNTNMLTILWK